eukprot:86319_1
MSQPLFVLFFWFVQFIHVNISYQTIPRVEWKKLKAIGVLKKTQPFVILNSPLHIFLIMDYLPPPTSIKHIKKGNKFLSSLFQSNNTISSQHRTINCSCIAQIHSTSYTTQLCNNIGSVFLYENYKSNEHNILSYWTPFESCNINQYYAKCIQSSVQEIPFHQFTTLLLKEQTQKSNQNILHYKYLVLKLLQMIESDEPNKFIPRSHKPFSDMLKYMLFEPFYKLFDIKYPSDVDAIHLWMGSNQSTSVRHYDSYYNLYFVLRGSKIFRISKPTVSRFMMYPFIHSSGRH